MVGISLKQISDNTEAVLKERNTEKTFKDPNIEDKNFTINDIRFEIDNIHINQTISTYIKFGRSFGITLSSSTSEYGNIFTSVVEKNNFLGCQFHPEKSSDAGEYFLQYFFQKS